MKKFLLLSASALISFISVTGENVRETIRPTYLIPGAELKVAKAKSIIASNKLADTDIHKASVKSMTDVPHVKFVRTNGTALDVTPKNVITIDTALVISYDHDVNNDHTDNLTKIEYDKYGRRSFLIFGNDSTRYTYTVDNNTRWLSREIERNFGDKWRLISKEERTIENDLVKSVTFYQAVYDPNKNKEVFYKSAYYEFEYGHPDYVHLNGKNIKNAAITHSIVFSESGDTIGESRHKWVNSANRYICTYSYSKTDKYDAIIYDDRVVTTYYERSYSYETEEYTSDFIKMFEKTEFFGNKNGCLEIHFNKDGSERVIHANLCESWKESNGDSIRIDYSYDKDYGFLPSYKSVYSIDYFKPWDYTSDFCHSDTLYKYKNGDWVKNNIFYTKHHILPNGLSELTKTINGKVYCDIVKMIKINTEDYEQWESCPVFINNDESYTAVRSDNYDYFYYYYGSDGSLQKTIWQKQLYDPDGIAFYIKLPGMAVWNPFSEYTNTISSGTITKRTVYKTTDDGKPLSLNEYTTNPNYNGGIEFKSIETLYNYKENGDFSVEIYKADITKDIPKLAISEKNERLTLEDGTIQTTNVIYNDNGSIGYGYCTTFKDFVIRNYNYDIDSASWIITDTYVEDEIYTTENGIDVRIQRKLSRDNSYAIKETKYETSSIYDADNNLLYDMEATYRWNPDNNKWIGEEKYENKYFHFIFDCKDAELFDPISAYNDEYMVIIPDKPYSNPEINDSKSFYYKWDTEKDEWFTPIATTLDYKLEGNTLTRIETVHSVIDEPTRDQSLIIKKTHDSFNRISEEERIKEEFVYSPSAKTEHNFSHTAIYYTYHETNGFLSERKEVTFDENGKEIDSSVYRYTYSTFNIETSEITDIVKDDNSGIIIDGLNVSAAGEIISVFNIKGQLISRESEATTLPSVPGIYIIKAGNCTHKIAIR